MVFIKSGYTDTGTIEYYLVGLELYEDFDTVQNQLKHLGARIEDTLDRIYSRTANLEKEGIIFKIIYHEDVGVYLFIVDQQSPQLNDWLKQILEKVVLGINLQKNP